METFEYSFHGFAQERFIRGVSSVQESEHLEEGAERGHGRNEKPQRCISTTGTRTILDPSPGVANLWFNVFIWFFKKT